MWSVGHKLCRCVYVVYCTGMHRTMQPTQPNALKRLIEKQASVCELLQTGALRGYIVRCTLLLRDGTARAFELKELLKSHGCAWDKAEKAWKRTSPTAQERYAVTAAIAREATRAAEVSIKEEARLNSMLATVNVTDAARRVGCWVGMPLAPLAVITAESRAAAWARHGMGVPSMRVPFRDVYGNLICA